MFDPLSWLKVFRGAARPIVRRPRHRTALHVLALEERLVPDSGGAVGQLASGTLKYGGGPLIKNVSVHPIFLKDANTGTQTPAATQALLDGYFKYMAVTGSYLPTLISPYSVPNFPIGLGNVGADDAGVSVSPSGTVNGSPAVDDTQIQQAIDAEIAAGRTAPSNPNNLYFVFTPPGDVVTAGGANSITTFLGYHTGFQDSRGNVDYYAVIADPGAPNSNLQAFGLTAYQQLAQVSSHEFAEAITDPGVPIGWQNPATGGAGEVGDEAANESYTQDGYQVQYEWSNTLVGPDHAPGSGSPNLFVNQIAAPAVSGVNSSIPVATFTDPDNTLNANSFTAQVDFGDGLPLVNATVSGGANGVYVVSAKPNAPLVAKQYGTAFAQDGMYIFVYDKAHGGANSGAPLSVRNQPYTTAANAPFIYNADNGYVAHNFNLSVNAGNYVLKDNGQTVFTQPVAQTTGSITIGADPSADSSLTVDFSGGLFNLPITFDGGTGKGNHSINVTGGAFNSITDQFTSASAGTLTLTNGAGTATVNYSHVNAASSLTPTSVGTLTFNLPAAGASANLQDDGTVGNNISQLTSPGAAFPSVAFTDPTTALAVNFGSGYTVGVNGLDSKYNAPLTLSDGGAGNDTVSLSGTLTLGSANVPGNLNVSAGTINVTQAINATNGGAVSFTNSGPLTIATGAVITAAGAVTQTGAGAVSLGANITSSTAGITFASPVTLAQSTTLTGTPVTFSNTVNGAAAGAQDLTITGGAVFQKTVGAGKSLSSVTVTKTVSLAGNVTTAGLQTYTGDATLTGNAVLASSTGSNVTFGGKLDGAFALTVNTTGQTIFTGAVGSTTPLASITTDAGGSTTLGGALATSGAQTYNDAVTLGQATVNLAASSATFTNQLNLATSTLNVQGNFALTATATLLTQINGSQASQFGHVTHSGVADLGGATLTATRQQSFVPPLNTNFPLVGITGSGTLSPNGFAGDPEGAILNLGGVTFILTYVGGSSGHDVVLTAKNAPPTQVAFTQQPSDVTASHNITLKPAVTVAVEDLAGDTVTTDSSTVTIQAFQNGAKTPSFTASVQAQNGVATFSTLDLTVAGTYTLLATDGNLKSMVSSPFNVNPDVPATLIFEANPPATIVAGNALPTAKVDVLDQFGNLNLINNLVVTLTVPGTAAFSPASTQANTVNGVASFPNLTPTLVGTYALHAAANDPNNPGNVLKAADTSTFTVTANVPAQFAFATVPTGGIAGQVLGPAVVNFLDAYGNPATSTAEIDMQANGPGGFTASSTTGVNAKNGSATFSNLVLDSAGKYTLTAFGAGLAAVTSTPSFTITPDVPSQLHVASTVPSGAAGTALPDVLVDVQDQFGNLVNNQNAQVALASSPGTYSATAPSANGVATFKNITLNAAGNYTLLASLPSVGTKTFPSNTFTISPAAAAQLAFASNQTSATAGTPLNPVQAVVEDQFGNMIPSATGPIHLDAVGPMKIGADSTIAQGFAQFTNVLLNTAGSYNLTISAPNLHSATTANPVVVSPAAASQLTITTGPADTSADNSLPTLSVAITDAFGNLVSSASGTITAIANGPAGFPAGTPTQVSTTSGQASFPGLQLTKAGTYDVSFDATGLKSAISALFTVTPGNPTKLAFESSPTDTSAGTSLGTLKVDVEDSFANVVPSNAPITISAVGPGGLTGQASTAAVNGVATFTGLALPVAGSYTLQAGTSLGNIKPGSTSSFTVSPAAPSVLGFEASPGPGTAGTALPAFNVDVHDAFGNLVSGVPVTLSVGTGPGGLSAGTKTQTTVNGVASFNDIVLNSAGNYTLSAATPSVTAASSSSFAVAPAAATQLAVTTTVPDTVAGTSLPTIQVAIEDKFGNLVPTASATVTLTSVGPGGIGGAAPSQSTTGGVATFSGVKINTTGTYTLGGAAQGLTTTPGTSFHITPAAPGQLGVIAQPSGGTAGQALPPVLVRVQDAFGNPISGATVNLTVAGPGGLSAGATSATSIGGGSASFTGLMLQTAGSYTLNFSVGKLNAASSPIVINPASASQLTFTVNPVSSTAGTALPDFQVQVQDPFGNLVSSSPATIGLTVTGPGGSTNGPSATTSGGVATFHGVSFPTAGSYTLSAGATGLTSGTSTPFTISAGPAAQVNFESVPTSIAAGTSLQGLKVDVEDALGNLIPGASNAISLAVTGPAPLSAGPTSATASNGTAVFTGLTLDTAGSYTFTVSAQGLQGNTSAPLQVTPAAAGKLAFQASPSSATAGASVPDIVVQVQDSFGNLVNTAAVPVTLALTGATAAATAPVTVTSANGLATFHGLTLAPAGTFALNASATGLTSAISPAVSISPGAASTLLFDSQPGNGTAGAPMPDLKVDVRDAFGDPVSGVAVTLSATGPGGITAGATSATAQNGIATFSGLTLTAAGSYTFAIAAAGINAVSSAPFSISPAGASKLALVTPPANLTAGQSLPSVQVQLLDAFGNHATTSGSVISLTIAGPVSAGATATTAGGTATFSGLSLTTAGSYTLQLAAANLTGVTSPSFTVSPAAPSQLLFETIPASITAGQPLPALNVDIKDQFGNAVPSSAASVTLSVSGPGTFAGSPNLTAPATNGVASFTGLSLQTAGSYTLAAGATGLTSATAPPLTVTPADGTQLVFETPPAAGTAGQPLAPLKVDILDAFGNLSTSTAPVTLNLSGPGSPVAGSTTAQAVGGVATFSGLILQTAGTYTYSASAANLSPTASASAPLAPAAATQVVFQTPPSAAGQQLAPLTADLLDPFGNLSASNAPVTLAISGPGGSSVTASAVNGVATFTGLMLPAAGTYTLIASVAGLPSAAASTVTASGGPSTTTSTPTTPLTPPSSNSSSSSSTAGKVSQVRFLLSSISGKLGVALPPIKVQLLDAQHRPVAGTVVTLKLKSGHLLGKQTLKTDKHGFVLFKGLKVTTRGHLTLLASTPGLGRVTPIRLNVT